MLFLADVAHHDTVRERIAVGSGVGEIRHALVVPIDQDILAADNRTTHGDGRAVRGRELHRSVRRLNDVHVEVFIDERALEERRVEAALRCDLVILIGEDLSHRDVVADENVATIGHRRDLSVTEQRNCIEQLRLRERVRRREVLVRRLAVRTKDRRGID